MVAPLAVWEIGLRDCPSRLAIESLLVAADPDPRLEHHVNGCSACQGLLAELCDDPDSESWAQSIARPGHPSHDSQPPVGEIMGYQIVREIGRGGMGVVYEAIDADLGRRVAIKMLVAGFFSGPDQLQRFAREAEMLANLKHPGIIQIHRAGEADGLPFLVLEFVDGPTLQQWMVGRDPSYPEIVDLIREVTQAIEAAHQGGVIHRDLKPANVLIDQSTKPIGGQTAGRAVKIADFGLARFSESGRDTISGLVMGTPAYMSPEQVSGTSSLSPATDVYAIGAIFYELLCERPPFQGPSTAETIRMVVEADPIEPRMLNASIPPDLATICIKCLSKSPARRYDSAQALDDDLARWQNKLPIAARPISRVERVMMWGRRNRWTSAGLAAFAMLLVSSFVTITYLWNEARRANEALTGSIAELERRAYFSGIDVAARAIEANDPGLASVLLEELPAQNRGWEWGYLRAACNQAAMTFADSSGPVTAVACSPDGRLYAAGHRNGRVVVRESRSHQVIQSLSTGLPNPESLRAESLRAASVGTESLGVVDPDARDRINCLVFDPTGQILIAGNAHGILRWWRTESWNDAEIQTGPSPITSIAIDPRSDSSIAFATDGGGGGFADLSSGKVLRLVDDKDSISLQFSQDGESVFSGHRDGRIESWDTANGLVSSLMRTENRELRQIAIGADTDDIICVGDESRWRRYRISTAHAAVESVHAPGIGCCAIIDQGQTLVTGGHDGTLGLWNIETGDLAKELLGHHGAIHSVVWDDQNQILITGGADGTTRIWDRDASAARRSIAVQANGSIYFDVDDVNDRCVTGGDDRIVRLWNADLSELLFEFPEVPTPITSVCVSRDGRWAVVGLQSQLSVANFGDSDGVWIFDLVDRQHVGTIGYLGGPVTGIAIDPQDQFLYTRSRTANLLVWDLAQNRLVDTIGDEGVVARTVGVSADGRWLAAKTGHSRITCWERISRNRLFDVEVPEGRFTHLAISPDGRTLAVGTRDGRIYLHSIPDGKLQSVMSDSRELVSAIAYSPDGSRLVSAHRDGTIRLWDTNRSRRMLTIAEGFEGPRNLRFDRSGEVLYFSSNNGRLHMLGTRSAPAEAAIR